MLRTIETVAGQTRSSARKRVLGEQVRLLSEVAEQSLEFEYERAKVREWIVRARKVILVTDRDRD